MQRSMVAASMRSPRAGFYVIQDVCDFEDPLDTARLRQAWATVAARHATLRSAVEFEDGKPAALSVLADPHVPWVELDWTEDHTEARLAAFLRDDREAGFAFDGVPMRITIIRRAASSTVIWTSHHVLLDGRAYLTVWMEWLIAYDSPDTLDAALAAGAATGRASDSESYWRSVFDGISQTTDYIVDRIGGRGETGHEMRISIRLPAELTTKLAELGREHGVSVNNLLQGAWALVLARHSGRREIVFGVTRACRDRADASVDFRINTLPLRIDVDPDLPLTAWLGRIREQWMSMRGHERTPLDQVWKWSGLPSGMPPFESVVVYDRLSPDDALRQLGVMSGRMLRRYQRTDSPLTLAAYGGSEISLDLAFDPRLISHRCASAVAGHVGTLLESFVSRPGARLAGLPMLTDAETGPTSRGGTDGYAACCAHELFESQAARTPLAPAIELDGGAIAYAEINARANRLAYWFQNAGIDRGDRVALLMEPSPDTAIVALAALKAGACFLPLDPAQPEERLSGMVASANAKIVIRPGDLDAMAGALAAHSPENPPNRAMPDDAAYAIYTSGSTGKPKAALVPHRGLVNYVRGAIEVFAIRSSDRRVQFASPGSDMIVSEIFNYLCAGATLVFGWDRKNTSMREFLRYLDRQAITITGMPSAWWNEWVASIEGPGSNLPNALRAVIIGMENVNAAAFRKWQAVAGSRVRLFNAYGPTEASCAATVYESGTSPWESDGYVPIGRGLPNVALRLADRDGNLPPAGVTGELYIGGPGVGLGYLNAPDATGARFVDGGWYRTGDLAFWLPDGNLVFAGRTDRQVKIRGYRIELEEIESVLAGAPGVGPCAVIVDGRDEKAQLIAYYAAAAGPPSTVDAVRAHLAARLPRQMIPAAIVSLPVMPMTANGKVDRQALPAHTGGVTSAPDARVPLSTPAEHRLAAIWREVLRRDDIGAEDDFFEAGADSLDATRLITIAEAQFGREIPLALLWRNPTLRRMAALLEEGVDSGTAEPVVTLQAGGSRLPFFCIPGADENPHYFRELARCLGRDQPFHVVRDPRPLDARGVYTVEEAASRLLESIRGMQADGPYLVGGHCFGGVMAFEIARQLIASGATVAAVILMEVATPGYPKVLRSWKKYGRQFASIARGEIGWDDVRAHAKVVTRLAKRRAAIIGRRALFAGGMRTVVEPIERAEHPNALAGRSYQPRPLGCEVIQFIAAGEQHSTRILDDPRLGWRDFAATFTVVETPGGAAAIFRPPDVRGLAARMSVEFTRVYTGNIQG